MNPKNHLQGHKDYIDALNEHHQLAARLRYALGNECSHRNLREQRDVQAVVDTVLKVLRSA